MASFISLSAAIWSGVLPPKSKESYMFGWAPYFINISMMVMFSSFTAYYETVTFLLEYHLSYLHEVVSVH